MIAKKNSGQDLERKRTTLFTIGLLAAGSFTLAAFTYKSPIKMEEEKLAAAHQEVNYLVETVHKEQEKVETQTQTETDTQTQDQSSIDADAAASDQSQQTSNSNDMIDPTVGIQNLGYNMGDDDFVVEEDDVDEEIIEFADKDAEFVGGYVKMIEYINANIEYPEDAIELGDQGRVGISFVVEKDGSITNVKVDKGVTKSLDREAKRIVKSFPNWSPGELDAKKVRTRVRLPIVFLLSGQ
jgi:protein TonB